VVFTRCRLDFEECNIAHVVIDTGEITFITPITRGIEDQYPRYAPDGKSITFSALSREGVVFAVYRLDLNSAVPVRLTPAILAGAYSDWSPDGSRIAFASHQVGDGEDPHNSEIIRVNADGTGLTRLTFIVDDFFNSPHDFQPSWSPEGDAIVFERDAPDFSSGAIYMIKLDGSAPAKILTLPKARTHFARQNKAHPGTRGKNTLEQIKDGGFGPSWGPAQQ
jgi:Tol biopolymer transport system component